MKIDQEVIVRTEKIAHGGFVVARWEEKVLFVRKALPNELVKIKVIKKAPGGRAWIAESIEVIEANPNRVSAPCVYFKKSDCGGCDFQHASIDYQLELKRNVVVEQMQRLADLSVEDLLQTHQLEPKDYHWRNKLRLAPAENGQLGFRKFRSHEVIPIKNCAIAASEINSLLESINTKKFSKEQLLVVNNGSAEIVPQDSLSKTTTKILGHEFVHLKSGFWQSHLQAAEKLSAMMLSKVQFQRSVLDLYAGVGIFGRLLLEEQKTIELISVELDRGASSCAKENLKNFSKAKVVTQKAEDFLAGTQHKFDLVILDPPRRGLGVIASRRLAEVAGAQIIYLSCDPASLARDSKIITENGWHLSHLDLIDAFPQTHHLETMAVFSKDN